MHEEKDLISETPLHNQFNIPSKFLSILNDTVTDSLDSLSDWQWSRVADARSEPEVKCLLRQWFEDPNKNLDSHLTCSSKWDEIYCWPHTPAGTSMTIPCSELLGHHLEENIRVTGNATRFCSSNGTWYRGNKTTYFECVGSMVSSENENTDLVAFVQYMVFYGSIASLFCLGLAVTIFCMFRSVWSERIKVHVHLMLSLILRYAVYLVITFPHVLNTESHYRNHSLVCKCVLVAHVYATIASVYWMLAQGIYINRKLTTDVFPTQSRKKFKIYYIIGWVLPLTLLMIYVVAMVTNQYPGDCWQGYAETTEMQIILLPTQGAILINAFVLLNVLRIVITKSRRINEQTDFSKVRSVAKVTLFLFPILGLNNLISLYNPKDEHNTLFVTINTVFGSTQGIWVAIVYCFNCNEVRSAIRRSLSRFRERRSVRNEASGRRNMSILSAFDFNRRRNSITNNVDSVVAEEIV